MTTALRIISISFLIVFMLSAQFLGSWVERHTRRHSGR